MEPARGPARPRLAMYWASACGGCEVSLLNIGEHLLQVGREFELAFCPCLADVKLAQVRAFPDGHLDLCLFNGAVRSTEHREMANLLRRKSRILVAFGSCAHEGCVPGLANLTTALAILDTAYRRTPSTENPDGRLPQPQTSVPGGPLELPTLFNTVLTLDQVEQVDYYVPGCPPESERVREVLQRFAASLAGGDPLPERGSVLGAGRTAVCEECPRDRLSRQVTRFVRPHEVVPDPKACLLEQGLVCLGVATRSGCGALCPRVGMVCEGCYGPPEGVADQGAKMVAALAATLAAGSAAQGEARLQEEVDAAAGTVPDPAGTFYRFSLAHSLLRRARMRTEPPAEGSPP